MSALQLSNAESPRLAATGAWRQLARTGGKGLLVTVFLVLMIAGAGEIGWRPREGIILLAAALLAALLPVATAAVRRNVRTPARA